MQGLENTVNVMNQLGLLHTLTSNHLSLRKLGSPICTGCPCFMRPIENGGRAAIRGIVGEERSIFICVLSARKAPGRPHRLTQASFVILIRICEVKVTVKLSIVELDSHRMMCLLVDGPDSTSQIQTCLALARGITRRGISIQRYLRLPAQGVLPGWRGG